MAAIPSADSGDAIALSLGRKKPQGACRWYLVRMPRGRERAIRERLRALIPSELLQDAFVLTKERWFKSGGVWSLEPVSLCRGYAFVATPDVGALDEAFSVLSFSVEIVGSGRRVRVPLDDEARVWLSSAMDADHVLRNSIGTIEDGKLRVVSGPLKGQEERVSKIDRHGRLCLVRVGQARGHDALSLACPSTFRLRDRDVLRVVTSVVPSVGGWGPDFLRAKCGSVTELPDEGGIDRGPHPLRLRRFAALSITFHRTPKGVT